MNGRRGGGFGAGDRFDDLPTEIDLALEEYRTVREEELVALQSQITTLRYGITGCVVLIGVAAQQHADRYLGWAISLALVPLVVLFSAVIWMGEYERVARAGHYIARLERRINAMLSGGSKRTLRWEGWLREGGYAHSRLVGGQHRYLAIAGVFIGFQIAAVAMGLHFYWHNHAHDSSRKWLLPVAVAVNVAILFTLLGYFRSSYERLRGYTAELEEPTPVVRQRVRMRLKLYGTLGAVGFISTPFLAWLIGIFGVWGLDRLTGPGHIPIYWIALPSLLWMAIIPLVQSRGLMRELFSTRILHEEVIAEADLKKLERRDLLSQLTSWELELLRRVDSEDLNAPSIGRNRHIVVTNDALSDEEDFRGILAHEVGHHRLHHLYPLALSYIYLWPYFYYDERFSGRLADPGRRTGARAWRAMVQGLFSLVALPGWLAWVVLRWGWRAAEYDADRYACVSGNDQTLVAALHRHERIRQKKRAAPGRDRLVEAWKRRLAQSRALGYLPVPNEHPIPARRIRHIEKWQSTRLAIGGRRLQGKNANPSESWSG